MGFLVTYKSGLEETIKADAYRAVAAEQQVNQDRAVVGGFTQFYRLRAVESRTVGYEIDTVRETVKEIATSEILSIERKDDE